MRQKVLMVITKSEPLGGAGRYVLDLATGLPQSQFEVVVVVGGEGVLKTRLQSAGIRVISVKKLKRDISLFAEFSSFFTLLSIFNVEKPDIVHLNSSKAGGLGALAARLCGIRHIIFTGHGWAFNEDRGFVSRTIIGLLHWVTILLAHKTIAVSAKTAEDIQSLPFIKKRIAVIHNGIPPIDFASRDDARKHLASFSQPLKEFLDGHPSSFLIGINSELHRNKGIDIALEAIAPILKSRKNLALIVTGNGEERERLHQQKVSLGDALPIFFLGNIPDMRKYLKAYDLFCMPSRTEALPYSVLEAARAGLPIIATNVGGIPEIITHLQTGVLVPKESAGDLREALLDCLNAPNTCESMGHALNTKVTEHFSTTSMIQKTTALYGN
jgi:glycosyltransferase involved in cell wall biosynthesis